MSTSAQSPEVRNPKTGMTHPEMKEFIRNHFEEFVNRKNLRIGEVNFAPEFVDHGADVPAGLPAGPPGAIQYVGAALKKVPDLRVNIEDLIAEDDKVVVRNHWTGTDEASSSKRHRRGLFSLTAEFNSIARLMHSSKIRDQAGSLGAILSHSDGSPKCSFGSRIISPCG